ncbi:peptide-methionine (R)-S-oxide reductase MsrB [Chryseosolibacter indicus]|uniref:Peptide methionine sulfoxide reductase MsrB n=1 Tax=Chryseosolibacter indicus TaxID=2782351 RepID=A0ABS5VSW3_9BACT|nr:peptide-methionine (R)-S-oxide reductase MsrB [Chryseosolibacter indicus]MBT1703964.1 peptide-methionine (R)-S-oxide reductase MsrB [Chryseosolibacter indicus]
MIRYTIVLICILLYCSCRQQDNQAHAQQTKVTKTKVTAMETTEKIHRTEEEWKKILTPEQFHVLREKGTDAPFTGKLTYNKDAGMYYCAACGNELFSSDMKFDSHCGWPSFDREIEGGKIVTKTDRSYGMVRTEILCAKCGSHLGHLFDDGPTETGLRYCVNSTSLDFKPSSPKKEGN